MGLENIIHIIGVGADGDSNFRKFYFQTYPKHKLAGNCITLGYEGFDFAREMKRTDDYFTTTVMQPDWKHLIKNVAQPTVKYTKDFNHGQHCSPS